MAVYERLLVAKPKTLNKWRYEVSGHQFSSEKTGVIGKGGEYSTGTPERAIRTNVNLDKPSKVQKQFEAGKEAGKQKVKSTDYPSTVDYQVPYETMKTKEKPVQPEKMKHSKEGPKMGGKLSAARKQRAGERNYKW